MRVVLVAACLCLLAPAAASAATAEVTPVVSRGTYYVVSYGAADGEANDLTVSGSDPTIVLTDPGAEIEPGEGCLPVSDHSVTCTNSQGLSSVVASLGDEEDHFTSTGPSFGVDGGPGNDTLEGGAGAGALDGGDGDDVLTGGERYSFLTGGDGADTMTGTDGYDKLTGGPGPDTIDGRGESHEEWSEGDLVSYADHDTPVTVDLSNLSAPAGATGEGDSLTDVESAEGGRGPDRLTARKTPWSNGFGSAIAGLGGDDLIRGGPGNDELHGGGGNDRASGGGGDDLVGGQQGRDTLLGGGGSNEIWSFDNRGPRRDSVRCGEEGSVWVGEIRTPVLDLIDQSCDSVSLSDPIIDRIDYAYPGQPTRAVASKLACDRRCRVRIALRSHGQVLGSATRVLGRGESATLAVELTRAARDELAREGVLKLGFSMELSWGARLRHHQATSWHLLLHDPPTAR